MKKCANPIIDDKKNKKLTDPMAILADLAPDAKEKDETPEKEAKEKKKNVIAMILRKKATKKA